MTWLVSSCLKAKTCFQELLPLPPTAASAQSSADRLSAQNTDADDDDSADNGCVIDTKKWHQQSCPSLLLQLMHNHQLTNCLLQNSNRLTVTVMMMGLALEMNADSDQQVFAHKNGNAGDFDPQNHRKVF